MYLVPSLGLMKFPNNLIPYLQFNSISINSVHIISIQFNGYFRPLKYGGCDILQFRTEFKAGELIRIFVMKLSWKSYPSYHTFFPFPYFQLFT